MMTQKIRYEIVVPAIPSQCGACGASLLTPGRRIAQCWSVTPQGPIMIFLCARCGAATRVRAALAMERL